MRFRALAFGIVLVAASLVCVRLGLWQWSRYEYKRSLNASQRAAFATAPVRLTNPRTLADSMIGRRVAVRGVFDERRQVLLAGMIHTGEPGVHVITPLVPAAGSPVVLVDRGWLPAADAVHARPQDYPVPGGREVVGIVDTLGRSGSAAPIVIPADSLRLYSAAELDSAPLADALRFPLTRFYIRELPSAGAPTLPRRESPEPHDEAMHVGYAVQWFAFAVIMLVGPAALAWTRRRRPPA